MNFIGKIRESLRFNELTVGFWGVAFTFRWNPRVQAPTPTSGVSPWAVGLGCLLLGAALADSGDGGRDAGLR